MSVKRLHRDIMLSAVYQLATADNPAFADVDPDNDYYWRFDRQRLDAEGIRDALLYVSGGLDSKIGGPSLLLEDDENDRRTIYGEVSRFQVNEYLQTFDFPNPSLTAERRFATNVPLQSLYFMNSDFVHRQAERFVRRLVGETEKDEAVSEEGDAGEQAAQPRGAKTAGGDDADDEEADDGADLPESFDDRAMIEVAYPLLYGREVTEQEVTLGLEFLTEQRASLLEKELAELDTDEADDPAEDGEAADEDEDPEALAERRSSMKAWVQYARALFSAAEFRFID